MRHWLALGLALLSLGCFAQADYAREQRWADEITPAILVGDPVQLALPAGRKFLGIYAPNGKGDGLKLIPVSEVAAKDEFLNIKNVTRDDQMAAHRVPWQIMGVPPPNGVNAGDPEQVAKVVVRAANCAPRAVS